MKKRKHELPEVYNLSALKRCAWVSSSVPRVNMALGGEGIPQTGITEMYGSYGGGKTTLALTFRPDLFIDIERSLDPAWAEKFAPDVLVSRPGTLDKAFDLVEEAAASSLRLIVVDSIGGGLPEAEVESRKQGTMSALLSRRLRRLIGLGVLDKTALVLLNQIRASFAEWGSPTTTPGGYVLHHLAVMRIEVRRLGWVELSRHGRSEKAAQEILIRVTKNKTGRPWSEASLVLGFDGAWYESVQAFKHQVREGGNDDVAL